MEYGSSRIIRFVMGTEQAVIFCHFLMLDTVTGICVGSETRPPCRSGKTLPRRYRRKVLRLLQHSSDRVRGSGPARWSEGKIWLEAQRGFSETRRMINTTPSPAVAAVPAAWSADVIFSILAEPSRRAILLVLAHGKALPTSVLKGGTRRRLDATLKHLATLCTAGFLVTAPDPTDGRRTLYTLAPAVPVVKTPEGAVTIDFGCCLLRA